MAGTGTRPLRVPEEIHAPLRALSALSGKTPGEILAEAFFEYCNAHKLELADVFERAQKFIAAGDTSGLASLTAESRKQRAERAARAARVDPDSAL